MMNSLELFSVSFYSLVNIARRHRYDQNRKPEAVLKQTKYELYFCHAKFTFRKNNKIYSQTLCHFSTLTSMAQVGEILLIEDKELVIPHNQYYDY